MPARESEPSRSIERTGVRPSATGGRTAHARFHSAELAIVCSHYDLGVIRSIHRFPRGSPESPKLVLDTTTGRYLLKRRAPGQDNPYRVALSHSIQLHLARRQFPVARLVGTRTENNSMLQIGGRIYELFEFIEGQAFDGSAECTGDAGRALAWYHRLIGPFSPQWKPPAGSYHDSASVRERLSAVATMNRQWEAGCASLLELYEEAARRASEAGAGQWPTQIIHGDWHPGNMLFRSGRVAAVIDLDNPRTAPRAMDVASAALQFSLERSDDSPATWPEGLALDRYRRFLTRYDAVDGATLSEAEIAAIPHLMIQSLIAEAVSRIAGTGRFGRFEPPEVLEMVGRKSRWIRLAVDRLIRFT